MRSASLILSDNGSSLVVRGGKLVHWVKGSGAAGSWTPASFPFDRVSVECQGGVVSWPAMRTLAEHGIPLTVLDFDGRVTSSILPASAGHANSLLGQVRASLDPARRVKVVRFILKAKLGHEPPASLDTVDALRLYEGRQAERFWGDLGIVRDYPHAHDTRNAALNYSFGILESTVRLAVHRAGLSPSVGFLHVSREGKDSFVYDAMEPWRGRVAHAALSVRLTTRDAFKVFRIGLKLRREAARRLADAVGAAVEPLEVEQFLGRLRLSFG